MVADPINHLPYSMLPSSQCSASVALWILSVLSEGQDMLLAVSTFEGVLLGMGLLFGVVFVGGFLIMKISEWLDW